MKKIIFTISILSLLILSACSTQNTNNTSNEPSLSDTFSGTLADAIKLGKNYKCTAETNGVNTDIYVKGKKFRSESNMQGRKFISIMDESNCLWTWEENSDKGSKICINPSSQQTSSSAQANTDAKVECNAMVVSENLFIVPSNMQFTDLSQALNNLQSRNTNKVGTSCSEDSECGYGNVCSSSLCLAVVPQ